MQDTATTPVSPVAPATQAPVMTLTPAAVAQVKNVIQQQGFDGYYLTVRVVPSGCSGLGYDLNIQREAKPGDIVWEQEGVKIATDGMSRQYLAGTTVDYQTTPTHSGFKFENPNAKSSCGCGSSFST